MRTGEGIKVIVSMIGLDGHTTGAEVVARVLRDASFEVVYLGVNQTPEMIVQAAIQEDVDVIGISSHASNYAQIRTLVDLVRKNKLDDVLVVCGGNIPKHQADSLRQYGVAEVFTPGSSREAIVNFIASRARSAPAGSLN